MADAASTPAAKVVGDNNGHQIVTWGTTTITGAATGNKVSFPSSLEALSIQFVGTWGSATAVVEGSNDGTNFVTCYLLRQQAVAGKQDAASFTADGAAVIADIGFLYYRVRTSGGTGTALVATLVASIED